MRTVGIDEYRMEARLEGGMLLIQPTTAPNVIGFIGNIMGSHLVNIADVHLRRIRSKSTAICLVTPDIPASPAAFVDPMEAPGSRREAIPLYGSIPSLTLSALDATRRAPALPAHFSAPRKTFLLFT